MNKLTRNDPDEARQMNNLVFALCYTAGMPSIDSMTVSRQMEVNFGITLDWHDAANALDDLATNGKLRRSGTNRNGNATYDTILEVETFQRYI